MTDENLSTNEVILKNWLEKLHFKSFGEQQSVPETSEEIFNYLFRLIQKIFENMLMKKTFACLDLLNILILMCKQCHYRGNYKVVDSSTSESLQITTTVLSNYHKNRVNSPKSLNQLEQYCNGNMELIKKIVFEITVKIFDLSLLYSKKADKNASAVLLNDTIRSFKNIKSIYESKLDKNPFYYDSYLAEARKQIWMCIFEHIEEEISFSDLNEKVVGRFLVLDPDIIKTEQVILSKAIQSSKFKLENRSGYNNLKHVQGKLNKVKVIVNW